MYIFCPLTKSLDSEDSRSLINFHEYIQPIKVHTLKYIHKTKYNPKLNNLIQNTPYEFSLKKEEHNTILWPLLQKNMSSACLPNSSHHQTKVAKTSQTDFLPMTTLCKVYLSKLTKKFEQKPTIICIKLTFIF